MMPELADDLLCGGEGTRKSSKPGLSIAATPLCKLVFSPCVTICHGV
jgi:GTP:adenosylcobinamide-phosphate guanylyltransferase